MSSANEVQIKMTAADAEVVKMWQRQQSEIYRQRLQLERLRKVSKSATNDIKTGFKESSVPIEGMNVGIGKMIALLGGATGAVALFKKQYQELMKYQDNREVEGRTFGEQMRATRINFTKDETLSNKDLEKEVLGVAGRTNTKSNLVAAALSDAFSAKGKLTNKDALNAVEAAFALQPNDLDAAQVIAARSLDVANRTGNTNMKENVGFMQNIANTARVTKLPLVGKNLLPAISSIQNFGDTPEQSAELVVSLNKLLEDEIGAVTGTATKALAGRLKNFVPTVKNKDDFGKFKLPQDKIDTYNQAKTATERVKLMQQNPDLARAFFSKNPFAQEYDAVIKRFLSGDAGVKGTQDYVREAIYPLGKEQGVVFNEKLADIKEGGKQHLVSAAEANKSNVEQFRLSDDQSAITSGSRNLVNAAIDENPAGWAWRQTAWATHLAGKMAGEAAGIPAVKMDNMFLRGMYEREKASRGGDDSYVKFLEKQAATSDALTSRYMTRHNMGIATDALGNSQALQQQSDSQKKAIEENTKALKDNNRLREKEQRTPSTAPVPQRSREPFKLSAEKLSRGD